MNNIIKTAELIAALAKIAFYTSVVYITFICVAFFIKNIY